MSVLRFQTNVPVEVALAYSDGKQVDGQYGPQHMFSLAEAPNGEKTMYVPPIVAERFRELHIDRGQRVRVCKAEVKNGNRRGIEWRVTRIDPDPRWENPAPGQPAAPPPAKVVGAAAPVRNAGSDPSNGQSTTPSNGNGKGPVNGNGHATANGIPYWDPKTELLHSIEMAIEIAPEVERFAAAQGYSLRFTSDDVRAIGISLFIEACKNRRFPANGALR